MAATLASGVPRPKKADGLGRPRGAGYVANVSSYAHRSSNEDPEKVPIRHAATVMIVDDRPDLHVLMVQRTSRAVFGPSAWVFPGGRVDPDDAAESTHVVHGLDPREASARLEVEKNGRAWWIAGLRETLEEAGLLLGAGNTPLDLIERTRDAVHADASVFVDVLERHGLSLDISRMIDVGRFITPPGPPRRFDARFFLAAAPEGQIARHDEDEVVRHEWIQPAEAIAKFQREEFPMMSVTHRMLACLARYDSVADAMAVACERRPHQRVRVNDPDGAYEVVLPGEPGYETADIEIEHGWIRI